MINGTQWKRGRKKMIAMMIFLGPLLFWNNLLLAQDQALIQGVVMESQTGNPIVGATVVLLDVEPLNGAVSDLDGRFEIRVPVGKIEIEVKHLGYQEIKQSFLVEKGDTLQLVLELNPRYHLLQASILPLDTRVERVVNPVSVKTISLEETLRFPATFYDPARLASTFSGVVNDNDQANGMSIRGNSPNSMTWRLEGVEIVNPNHLSNAGTFSDRATQNGGGVNILSAQLLGTSYFFTGAFPATYGNALSGVMDMQLRRGARGRKTYTFQAGLLGLDLAMEGPLNKNKSATFLVNYRYSTLGLLTALGVELTDEDIAFQDLSFNINVPETKAGKFSFFGMGGASKTIFEAERDTSVWQFQKDRFDIAFRSKMGVLGATHEIDLGSSWTKLRTALAVSARDDERLSDRLSDQLDLENFADDHFIERKIAFSTQLYRKLGTGGSNFRMGVNATDFHYQLNSNTAGDLTILNGNGGGVLLEPFINLNTSSENPWYFNLGLHYQYFTFNGSQALEPRLSITRNLANDQKLSLAYGLHSKLQLAQLYYAELEGGNPNESLDFTKAHHLILGYQKLVRETTQFTAEVYYQRLFDVPIIDDRNSTFSALNLLEQFIIDTLANKGLGENFGIELGVKRALANQYFYDINGTYYESKYKGGDQVWRDTRFNGNYILNVIGGKEFFWSKETKTKVFGINARLAYYGGFRDTPIDVEASQLAGTTIYKEQEAYTIQQQDYFKIDLRLYWKIYKKKFSSTLALDLQNVSNQKNVAYSYFDPQQGEVVVKNQLGLIPILSYRVVL